MTDLPLGWAETTLKMVCSKITDGTHHSPVNLPTGEFMYVTAKNIKKWGLDLSNISFVSAETHNEIYGRCPVEKGDVLYIKDGATTGLAIVNHLDEPFSLLSSVALLKPSSIALNADFLKYWLNSPDTFKMMLGQMTGTAIRRLTLTKISSQSIALPPPPEQKRIVRKLNILNARSSRARFDLQAIPALVQRYKLNFLRSVFRGEQTGSFREANNLEPVSLLLEKVETPEQGRGGRKATDEITPGKGGISVNNPETELPEGWDWVPILRVARQETGHTPSRSHPEWWGGDVHWISIPDANTHHGRVIHDTVQMTNEEGLANSSARLLPEGTVVLSRTASVGYVTIMGREMATSQDFATWTCTEALEPKYLMYALMSEGDDIRDFGKGTTHTTIYFPEIRAFNIKLAPLEEQREIVRRVEAAFGMVERLAAEAEKALKLTDRLDQLILAKAFAGELVPQDPNDEAASAMLARIELERNEREKAATEARKTRPARISEPRRPELTDLLDVLEQQKSWISATKAAQGLGLGDGTSSDDIEAFYHQLKKFVESSTIEVERRDGEDWLRLANVEAN